MESYNDNTLVAFVDISGFKAMMQTQEDIYGVMRKFYNEGYKALLNQFGNKVGGFFVSDCGILFARDGAPKDRTDKLLEIIAKLNRKMLQSNIMLTTSIAFGNFRYVNLTEHGDIQKMGLFGEGYLKAYINAEVEEPKMTPGQCRITIKGLNNSYKKIFEANKFCYRRENFNLPTIETKYKNKYFYYYWMIKKDSSDPLKQCKEFEVDYTECYKYNKQHKYLNMKQVLKKTYHQNFPN